MEAIKGKLGPFPVWVWLLIITIAGLLWWVIASKKSAASTTAADTAAADQAPEIVVQTGSGTAGPAPAQAGPTGTPGPVPATGPEFTAADQAELTADQGDIKKLDTSASNQNKRLIGQQKEIERREVKPKPKAGTHPATAHPAKKAGPVHTRRRKKPVK